MPHSPGDELARDTRNIDVILRLSGCDGAGRDEAFALAYGQIKTIAQRLAAGERPGSTLGPTDLMHEAFVKLADGRQRAYNDLGHFLSVVATAMRNVLVDHARARGAQKRTPPGERVLIEWVVDELEARVFDIVAFNDLLALLRRRSELQADIVDLHMVACMTLREIALAFELPEPRIQAEWYTAKDWLAGKLGDGAQARAH